jgi:hypothetical protein
MDWSGLRCVDIRGRRLSFWWWCSCCASLAGVTCCPDTVGTSGSAYSHWGRLATCEITFCLSMFHCFIPHILNAFFPSVLLLRTAEFLVRIGSTSFCALASFARSNTGVVGSNPTRDSHVSVFVLSACPSRNSKHGSRPKDRKWIMRL